MLVGAGRASVGGLDLGGDGWVTVHATAIGAGAGGPYADYLVDGVKARALESNLAAEYYTVDAKELGAQWYGKGAELLGLEGEPTLEQLTALFEWRHPIDGSKLGTRAPSLGHDSVKFDADGNQVVVAGRESTVGWDLTFAADKTVSVLQAFETPERAIQIDQAVLDATKAVLAEIEKSMTVRIKGVNVDAPNLTVALIPESTSRDGDPHLHVHAVISTRVQGRIPGEGGRHEWYAPDAGQLTRYQQGWSALFHQEVHGRLVDLGYSFDEQTQRFAAPVHGIPIQACDMFSSRSGIGSAHIELQDPEGGWVVADGDDTTVRGNLKNRAVRFAHTAGREPTALEWHDLAQQAARASKSAKPAAINIGDQRTMWHQTYEARRLDSMPTRDEMLAEAHTPPVRQKTLTVKDRRQILNRLAGIGSDGTVDPELSPITGGPGGKARFHRGDLLVAYAKALPVGYRPKTGSFSELVTADVDALLSSSALVRLYEGHPKPSNRYYSTEAVLKQELSILDSVQTRTQNTDGQALPDLVDLMPDYASSTQTKAAELIAGADKLVLINGAAGVGKTTVASPAIEHLTNQGVAVYGITTSSVAAQVLAAETGMETNNIAAFLNNTTNGENQLLADGGTLVIDEIGMVSVPHLQQILGLADQHEWRVVMLGDEHQLGAVGRGGMLSVLNDVMPASQIVDLTEVFRFKNVWERDASLQLRIGDKNVISTYLDNDRIVACDPDSNYHEQIAAEFLNAYRAGKEVCVFAPTTEEVTSLNKHLQTRTTNTRNTDSVQISRGCRAYVGDRVVTRRNDYDHTTDRNEPVRNRERWTVTALDPDTGGITLAGKTGTITLPADYVKDHLELGYAQTSHAGQGRTIDVSLTIASGDYQHREAFYVAMTRGKELNKAYVTIPNPTGNPSHNLDQAAGKLEDILDRANTNTPAIEHLPTQPAEPVLSPLQAKIAAGRAAIVELDRRIEGLGEQVSAAQAWLDRFVPPGEERPADPADSFNSEIGRRERMVRKGSSRLQELVGQKEALVVDHAASDPGLFDDAVAILNSRRREAVSQGRALRALQVEALVKGETSTEYVDNIAGHLKAHQTATTQLKELDPSGDYPATSTLKAFDQATNNQAQTAKQAALKAAARRAVANIASPSPTDEQAAPKPAAAKTQPQPAQVLLTPEELRALMVERHDIRYQLSMARIDVDGIERDNRRDLSSLERLRTKGTQYQQNIDRLTETLEKLEQLGPVGRRRAKGEIEKQRGGIANFGKQLASNTEQQAALSKQISQRTIPKLQAEATLKQAIEADTERGGNIDQTLTEDASERTRRIFDPAMPEQATSGISAEPAEGDPRRELWRKHVGEIHQHRIAWDNHTPDEQTLEPFAKDQRSRQLQHQSERLQKHTRERGLGRER